MIVLLMSPLRSGSHMVRSMLREDPSIHDLRGEHLRIGAADVAALGVRERTVLVPLKYGYRGFTRDCLDAATFDGCCALLLHRRDARAQAESLAHASAHGTWFGPTGDYRKPVVDDDQVARQRGRNATDLAAILDRITLPHEVLAYEDITVTAVAKTLTRLLGRRPRVVPAATFKIAPALHA